MVKVLVVDDDKMARQGLILSIRWEDFGMRVVGDAPNGLKALQFLDEHPVDLVLTDLAMPVMSGIELMKRAQETHPGVLFAVLTFHEDFEYTREALRLGAIDYISKLQLERENLDAVLTRIRDRFAGGTRPSAPTGGDQALVFFPVSTPRVSDLARLLAAYDAELEDLAQDAALWRPGRDRAGWDEFFARPPALEGWAVARVQGLLGEPRARIEHLLRLYQGHTLFYDYRPGVPPVDLTLDQVERPAPEDVCGAADLRSRLCSLEWLHHPDAFDAMVAQLKGARLAYLPLLRLLVSLEGEWNALYGTWTHQKCELPAFRVWQDVEHWLGDLRDFTYRAPALGSHSPEAQAGVLRAVRILHTEFDTPLHTAAVASRVHMSRSHFCTCFKQIIGQSFLDYLSAVRLDQARNMLKQSDLPVYEVARQCGYADERYFGRLFKQATGVLPQEYRRSQPSEATGTSVR